MQEEELGELIVSVHGLYETACPYVLYYDESNNVRSLRVVGNDFNVANPGCFVLGGVGHVGPPRPLGLGAMRTKFQVQANAPEVKLKHVARGNFLQVLGSQPLGDLLEWIAEQQLFIHFVAVDPVYWSIVDIIDSLPSVRVIASDEDDPRALKNALYRVLRQNPVGMRDLMRRYNYPNVGDARREFIDELLVLVEGYRNLTDPEHAQPRRMLSRLIKVLQSGRTAEALAFLEDEKPGVLIDGFGIFYANRLITFPNAEHVFDTEPEVRRYLRSGALGNAALSFRFVESHAEEGVQLSDVIIGLLGKAFTYCARTPTATLVEDLLRLSEQQARNLGTLQRLCDHSTTMSNGFALRILADDDMERTSLLFNRRW